MSNIQDEAASLVGHMICPGRREEESVMIRLEGTLGTGVGICYECFPNLIADKAQASRLVRVLSCLHNAAAERIELGQRDPGYVNARVIAVVGDWLGELYQIRGRRYVLNDHSLHNLKSIPTWIRHNGAWKYIIDVQRELPAALKLISHAGNYFPAATVYIFGVRDKEVVFDAIAKVASVPLLIFLIDFPFTVPEGRLASLAQAHCERGISLRNGFRITG